MCTASIVGKNIFDPKIDLFVLIFCEPIYLFDSVGHVSLVKFVSEKIFVGTRYTLILKIIL